MFSNIIIDICGQVHKNIFQYACYYDQDVENVLLYV
jgi:hypothetical protein